MSKFIPTKKSNSCPVCADSTGKCRTQNDSPLVLCGNLGQGDAPIGYRYIKPSTGIWNIFAPDNLAGNWQDRLEAKVERDRLKAEREAVERSALPSLESRHKLLSDKPNTLARSQNSDLLRRGLTQSEIDGCLSRGSLWQEWGGYGIGAIDPATGFIVGGQLARDDREPKYQWLLPGQTHLPETNQNPLAVWVSPDFDRTKPYTLHLSEGFLKPLVSGLKAWRSDVQQIWIGAAGGNFQDAALARVLSAFPNATSTTLYPDGGAVVNPNVMRSYRSLSELVPSLQVAWWGQFSKSDPDCDELAGKESIRILNWKQFEARKYQEFFTLTEKPSIVLNQRYLPKIPLPIQPGNLAVSSPTGSGKTEITEDIVYQFFQQHPDGLADLIGYRNNLLIQTTQRINSKGRVKITHKHDMGVNSGGWNGAPSLGYCLNSSDQRIQALHQAMDEGRMVLVVLDEIGFIVSHWLDMMRTQPKTGMSFARLLRRIGEGRGYIVGLQANLTAFPINLIREITGQNFPITLVENKYQGEPWKVKIRSVLSKKGIPSNHPSILGIGTGQAVLEALQAGEFPLVTTSSREWLELLDAVLTGQNFKLLRIDRFTVASAQKAGQDATPDQKIILKIRENPKEAIEQARALGYNAIGLTPTCETGISIDDIHFYKNIDYAPAGTSEAVLQRLARDRRNETPREVFATDRAADYRDDISPDPDRILKSWRLNAAQGFNIARVNESLTPEERTALDDICQDDLPKILSKFAAADLVRSNSDKASLNKNIEDRLKAEGHLVTHDEIVISSEFRDLWKTAKSAIADRNCQMFAAAAVTTPDEAHDTLRSGNGTREQIYSAQKTITLENYPGLDLDDPARAGRLMIDRRGKGLGDLTQFWLLKNPAVAELIDRACWKGHIGRGIVWAPSLKREALKVQTLADTGILAVIALDEYSEDSPEVQTLRSHCIQNCHQLRRVCGYAAAFGGSHSGIAMVDWILRRLEYKQTVSRKVGGRGGQVRFYKAVDRNPGDRSLVEAALAVKWEAVEPIQNKDSTPGSHDFSVLKLDRKIVTTGVPNLEEWRDSTPIVATDEVEVYEFEYIPTDEELAEWASIAA